VGGATEGLEGRAGATAVEVSMGGSECVLVEDEDRAEEWSSGSLFATLGATASVDAIHAVSQRNGMYAFD
jgi:hypothetical protein